MAFEGWTRLLPAAAAMVLVLAAEGQGEPKPIVVNYYGVPTQFEDEDYGNSRGGVRLQDAGAPHLLQGGFGQPFYQGDRGPARAYFIPNAVGYMGYYQPALDEATGGPRGRTDRRGPEGGIGVTPGVTPAVTVRPLQHQHSTLENGRDYTHGQPGVQHRDVAPQFDASYNGIVRRAGVRSDGRDYQGEPGVYAIRGGVFQGEYDRPETGERAYFFRQPVHLGAPGGGVVLEDPYAVYRQGPGGYLYNAAVRPRPLGYSPEIHARGDQVNSRGPEERRVYYAGRGDDDYAGEDADKHYGGNNKESVGYDAGGDNGRFGERSQVDREGGDHHQHQQNQHHLLQRPYPQLQQNQRPQYFHQHQGGVRQEIPREEGYRAPAKIPVRGVTPRTPQTYYERNSQEGDTRRFN